MRASLCGRTSRAVSARVRRLTARGDPGEAGGEKGAKQRVISDDGSHDDGVSVVKGHELSKRVNETRLDCDQVIKLRYRTELIVAR